VRSFPSSVRLSSCFFSIFHFSVDLIFSGVFPSTFQFLQQPVVEVEWNFRSYQPCSSTKVDFVHLIYDFFVPPHKNKIFFCFSYQIFVLFMFLPFICFFVVHMVDSVFFDTFDSIKMIFIYISVSAATGSGSGMDFQAPR